LPADLCRYFGFSDASQDVSGALDAPRSKPSDEEQVACPPTVNRKETCTAPQESVDESTCQTRRDGLLNSAARTETAAASSILAHLLVRSVRRGDERPSVQGRNDSDSPTRSLPGNTFTRRTMEMERKGENAKRRRPADLGTNVPHTAPASPVQSVRNVNRPESRVPDFFGDPTPPPTLRRRFFHRTCLVT